MLFILKKIPKYSFGLLVLAVIAIASIIHVFGNFYQVSDGVYRSGQLNKYNLEYYVQKHNIKTIINLRGESTNDYYIDQINIAKKHGVNNINYPLSNSDFLDFNQTSKIVNMLKNTKKPLLIHCAGGADRTSLVSALYQFGVSKQPVDVAKEEFSFIYGHVPSIREHVIAMSDSFDNYVKVIKKNGKKNTTIDSVANKKKRENQ